MGRMKYLGMTREGYKREMYGQVHTALAQGIPYKTALKRAGTTDKVFREGRAIFHRLNPQTPTKAYKVAGKREYRLKAPPSKAMVYKTAPATRPRWMPPPDISGDLLTGIYAKKRDSVEKWIKKQDLTQIKDRGQLKLFLDQKFNPAFSRIVYSHYKGEYREASDSDQ
jgi:hypothetical protein